MGLNIFILTSYERYLIVKLDLMLSTVNYPDPDVPESTSWLIHHTAVKAVTGISVKEKHETNFGGTK